MKKDGVGACAVCHNAGTPAEREMLREATDGEVLFTTLYWWNKKIRADYWKRPLLEARQIIKTGWSRSSATKVARFAKRHHADLIHTNTLITPEGGIAARALGLPHVWHLRELIGPNEPFRLRLEGPALGRYLSRHCSKLIANSRTSAERVQDFLPPELLEIVPNGIDLSRFTTKRDRPGGAPIVVAMVGNLSSRTKKHALFIEAASRVNPGLPVEFRIYGHDPSENGHKSGDEYIDSLRRLIQQRGLAQRFQWLGYFPNPAKIMSKIDVLVHPADNESFGRIVVEAMAAGLPVVGVRGGGVGEIVKHEMTGFLSDPNEPDQLAAFIERLINDADLRVTMGRNGRARAVSHYSLESCAASILRVYQAAMERPLASRHDRTEPVALRPSPVKRPVEQRH